MGLRGAWWAIGRQGGSFLTDSAGLCLPGIDAAQISMFSGEALMSGFGYKRTFSPDSFHARFWAESRRWEPRMNLEI